MLNGMNFPLLLPAVLPIVEDIRGVIHLTHFDHDQAEEELGAFRY